MEQIINKFTKSKYSIYLIQESPNSYRIEIYDNYSISKVPKVKSASMTKEAAVAELQRLKAERPKVVL